MLTLTGVRHRYQPKGNWVLKGIDFKLREGQRVGIIGDNGSGKSTLVNIILGVITPTEGCVSVNGRGVSADSSFSTVSYVGDPGVNENELGLPLGIPVFHLLKAFSELQPERIVSEAGRRIQYILGVQAFANRFTNDLSAGERKRVMLTMGTMFRRDLVILDEPTEGLDGAIRNALLSELLAFVDESKASLLLVSHREDELAVLTEELFRMDDGHLQPEEQSAFMVEWIPQQGQQSEVASMVPGSIQWRLRQYLDASSSWRTLRVNITRTYRDDV